MQQTGELNVHGIYQWSPPPVKAGILLFCAHPDDESATFGGLIAYYTLVRKVPVVAVMMTSGDAFGLGLLRESELRSSLWTCGHQYEPVWAGFEDCCQHGDLACCWDRWGGQDHVVGYCTGLIRRLRPEVVVCHDFGGEYGHPNHMAAGIASAEAWHAAADTARYRDQLDKYPTWQSKKCYVHLNATNPIEHRWDMPCDELEGKTPQEITAKGLSYHISQGPMVSPALSRFGLYSTTVGVDTVDNDLMQHIG